jgi:hypothetical protein
MYKTLVLCPVCRAILDTQEHPDKEPNAQAVAMLAAEHRRKHGRESPTCTEHDDWIHGWMLETEKITTEEHKARHILLHAHLDELAADFLIHTKGRPSINTIIDLMTWSHQQTINPTEDKK